MKVQKGPKVMGRDLTIRDVIKNKEVIKCPACGSDGVYAHTIIRSWGYVNVNDLECDDPCDFEADYEEVRDEPERRCFSCDHEWTVGSE